MTELCRICMIPKHDLTNLVKEGGSGQLERSGEKFEDCFGIKVTELPYCQRICRSCDEQLIDFYYFKQQALRTHNYLLDKAADLQAKCADIKEEVDGDEEQGLVKGNSPVEFFNIEYLDEDEEPTNVGPLQFVKKEHEDDVIKQGKYDVDAGENTGNEALDGYEQIESLMYEDQDTNESLSEDKAEDDELANNTKNQTEDKETGQISISDPLNNFLDTISGKKKEEECKKRKKRWKTAHKYKYRCDKCNRPFNREDSFQAHLNFHKGILPWGCEICGKRFKGRGRYMYHIKNHNGQRDWKCEICNKTFLIQWDLRLHMRTHSKDKLYICELCGKGFGVYCNLVNHRECHNETNSYECELCHAKLHTKLILQRHLDTVHKVCLTISKTCPLCNQNFTLLRRYEDHMKRCHPEIEILDENISEMSKINKF